MEQEIQFCTANDGVSIAYASVGSGPPFVKAANWMNHLEYDWKSPVWKHMLQEFATHHTLIRYDERGTGLSDRKVKELSLEKFVDDLEAVVDTLGIEKFPLFGISQGGPVAVAYAIRHPERVSHLILYGSFATGWKRIPNLSDSELEKRKAQTALILHGWGNSNPAFRQLWTTLCIPDGNDEEMDSFNDLQLASTSAETAARIFEALGEIDVLGLLPKLKVPVLVMHSRNDATVPFKDGRRMATMIPGARFVTLESNNHLLLEREPAWRVFVSEIRKFLGHEAGSHVSAAASRCPLCGRTYTEADMYYCLDDGSLLRRSGDGDGPESPTVMLR